MKRVLIAALCLLAAPMSAGVWDCDRPDDTRLEDVLALIAGRFDRPDAEYYKARHARLKKQLDRQAANTVDVAELSLYDDTAVALMRVGRFSDAIILLDRKAALLKPLTGPDARRHEKTALSNKAAVLVARYRADGDRRDLDLARQLLARLLKADEYNRDADYAVREVRWLLAAPTFDPDSLVQPNLLGVTREHLLMPRGDDTLARIDMAGAVVHLSRRIVHGGGWEDPDVFYALSLALWLQGRDEEAITAWLRVNELVSAGAATRLANAPGPQGLVRALGAHLGEFADADKHQTLYDEMRQAADKWVRERNEFAAEHLKSGRHPDTDAAFWAGFGAAIPQAGEIPDDNEPIISTTFVVGGIAAMFVLMAVLGGFAFFVGRRHPRAPTVDEV